MNPVRGIETLFSGVAAANSSRTFKLMNPVRGIETFKLMSVKSASAIFQINESRSRDWNSSYDTKTRSFSTTFKLMNPVRGIETRTGRFAELSFQLSN